MSNRLSLLDTIARGPRTHSRGCHKNGFTLIEVLVTVVVVSIGLLGLAGLQINGLRANMNSEARSKATLLASDIVERMRANPVGVAAGAYGGIAIAAGGCVTPAKICSNTSSTTAVNCTPAQMATFDAWVWACGLPPAAGVQRSGVTNRLTNGTASVICAAPCPAGSAHTVTVGWTERNPTNGAAAGQNITLTVVP